MSDASSWRVTLAQQLVARYTGVEAALFVCSAARNRADEHSDVDVLLHWRTIPEEAWRKARIAALDGQLLWMADTAETADPALQSQSEEFLLGPTKLKVDITHKTVDAVATLIADVVERGDAQPTKLLILGGMRDGIALHGNALIQDWQ